jgi:hypothetical protein
MSVVFSTISVQSVSRCGSVMMGRCSHRSAGVGDKTPQGRRSALLEIRAASMMSLVSWHSYGFYLTTLMGRDVLIFASHQGATTKRIKNKIR